MNFKSITGIIFSLLFLTACSSQQGVIPEKETPPTQSVITIMVPENYELYRQQMADFVQVGAPDPLETTTFIKKEISIPYTEDLIMASAQAAAGEMPTGGGPEKASVEYLKIENSTAYVLLNIDTDGWAGVSVSLATIHPLVEKTLLQFPEIKEIKFKKYENESKAKTPLGIPLDNPNERITKKPFGIKISTTDSPVQPEKFSGYHTGTDFEILKGEEDTDITVRSICDGELLLKQYVSGYGGVAIQKCHYEENTITVLYGHLRLSSIQSEVGKIIKKGETIGFLGKGYGKETDGERKHLHLSIHKGEEINYLGYVQKPELLNDWIDPVSFLKTN